MKKSLFALFVLIWFSLPAMNQNLTREAGIRGGITSGFTFRQYLDDYLSYEGILSFRKSGMQFTLLRQVHERYPFFHLDENFIFIVGYGGHLGYYFSDHYRPLGFTEFYYPDRKFTPVIGVNAYTSMEYRLNTFPVSLGIDYKPFFEFSLYQYFKLSLWDVAFCAKYRF
jgi:hypothetical protein